MVEVFPDEILWEWTEAFMLQRILQVCNTVNCFALSLCILHLLWFFIEKFNCIIYDALYRKVYT